jgi:hypothetical protein
MQNEMHYPSHATSFPTGISGLYGASYTEGKIAGSRQRPYCKARVLQRAEHEEGGIARHKGCRQQFDRPE